MLKITQNVNSLFFVDCCMFHITALLLRSNSYVANNSVLSTIETFSFFAENGENAPLIVQSAASNNQNLRLLRLSFRLSALSFLLFILVLC